MKSLIKLKESLKLTSQSHNWRKMAWRRPGLVKIRKEEYLNPVRVVR